MLEKVLVKTFLHLTQAISAVLSVLVSICFSLLLSALSSSVPWPHCYPCSHRSCILPCLNSQPLPSKVIPFAVNYPTPGGKSEKKILLKMRKNPTKFQKYNLYDH